MRSFVTCSLYVKICQHLISKLDSGVQGNITWSKRECPPSLPSFYPTTCASPGSPLIKNLTVAILQLSESGELKYLRDKWWASSCVGADGSSASEALQPHDLQGLFLLLGLGLGLGLLLALLELLSRAIHQAKDGKVREGTNQVV